MKRGKFIVFEGIEGSGKSTQTKMLSDYFKSNDICVHQTREASDGPIGKMLRGTYLSGKRKVDTRIINLLYVPDRLDHITNEEDGILSILESGINVISDRYYMSSAAIHSSLFFDDNRERLKAMVDIIEMNKINIDLLQPDVTFFIDVDPALTSNRIKERGEAVSIFDNYDNMFKQQVCYNSAISYIESNFGETIIRIDGNRSPEEIHIDVVRKLNELFTFTKIGERG